MRQPRGLWECPICDATELRDHADQDPPICEGCKREGGPIVEMRERSPDGEEIVTDGGIIADQTQDKQPIRTMSQLLQADFERVELAKVTLRKPGPGHKVTGRIIGRPNGQDLRLRYRGREYDIGPADEWSLSEFNPVTTSFEKELIKEDWDDAE